MLIDEVYVMKILSISTGHDSSVCLLNNGLLDFYSKEERLSRIKRDGNTFLSIDLAFEKAKNHLDFIIICSFSKNSKNVDDLKDYLKTKTNTKILVLHNLHHIFHSSLAYHNSGFDTCLSLVIDRQGSEFETMRESESIFVCERNKTTPIYKNFWLYNIGQDFDTDNYVNLENLKKHQKDFDTCDLIADSTIGITKVYESATTLIGQHGLENGKTMGLSAYGKEKNFKNLFLDCIPNTNLFFHKNDIEKPVLLKEHLYCQTQEVNLNNYQFYADYAFQVQKQTQEVILKLIKKYVKKTGIKNICISGGYGLNVVANNYLLRNLPDINFYFEPISDDSGISIGGALFLHKQLSYNYKNSKIKSLFFNNKKHNINFIGKEVSTKDIAKFLSEGKIVAVHNEMSEAGPRALGNRSILFDARNKNAKEIINKIKNREWYRPFAASILEEFANEYFDMLNLKSSPFMTVSFQSKTNKIPGVIHVDNSCRVQTVNNDIPHFYNLLKDFYDITNVPVLLNTSLNLSGEPLSEMPEDSYVIFNKSCIDILWFPEKKIMLTK